MREIKFRGKRHNGEWVYGSLVYSNNIEPAIYYETGTGAVRCFDWCYVDSDTIGQYIGLKDKNGKEIYEGDILRVKEFENLLMKEFIDDDNKYSLFSLEDAKGELRDEYVTPVVWNEGCFDLSTNGSYFNMFVSCVFGDMKRSSPLFEFEIVGNIYENADLIPHKLLSYINE